jgi:competence protein ComEC
LELAPAGKSATVYFVDVGQGACQVIDFHDGKLVILDCGKSATELIMLLNQLKFQRIHAVILSHWHEDHVGGVPALLKAFGKKIDIFYLTQDRPANQIQLNRVYKQICEEQRDHRYAIERLEFSTVDHGQIHGAAAREEGPILSVLFPNFSESLTAQSQSDANQGSGILLLQFGTHRILFPGDAGTAAFTALSERLNWSVKKCDILASPHHAGKLSQSNSIIDGYASNFQWLYQEIVQPTYLVVSAGTGNTHGHPIPAHLREAVRVGAVVVCTQMTSHCHSDVQSFRPQLPTYKQLPAECSRKGSSGVGCGGTVKATMRKSGVMILRLKTHQRQVEQLKSKQTPQCRL